MSYAHIGHDMFVFFYIDRNDFFYTLKGTFEIAFWNYYNLAYFPTRIKNVDPFTIVKSEGLQKILILHVQPYKRILPLALH